MGAAPAHFNRIAVVCPMYHWRAVPLRCLSFVFAVPGIAMLAGCAATVEQRGNLPTPEKLAEVKPGVTGKDEVIKVLGSPSSVSIFNDKSWYYISRRTGQTAFFEPDVLKFNNAGASKGSSGGSGSGTTGPTGRPPS